MPGKRVRSTEVTPAGIPLAKVLRGVEREEILAALEACDGNQTRAAELLGMPRRTLVWRMAKLRIDGARIRRQ